MPSYKLIKINEYDAHGGPSKEVLGHDGHMQTSTRSGRYVIGAIEKHVSHGKYQFWSGIAWGTEMRVTNEIIMVKHGGKWIRLSAVNDQWGRYKGFEKQLTDLIKRSYNTYYGKLIVPDRWVFNDFGHISVKYYADNNHNWKMDGKEGFLGDFIHTTPGDEANTYLSNRVILSESHGCIHVKPLDIDTMIGNGYIKKGNSIEVHNYNEKNVAGNLLRNIARPGFEVHFYPGVYKIAVYRVTAK
ncbi:hypothetical protein [Pedobacter nutrimenti]|uniref:hypothetical protein n=1 Tax=Pedobacter nutrimenti TaxID=1241337 RepID=UPI00292CBB4F|nr:hypothetical protein [Pedobacter nutrimenti]